MTMPDVEQIDAEILDQEYFESLQKEKEEQKQRVKKYYRLSNGKQQKKQARKYKGAWI